MVMSSEKYVRYGGSCPCCSSSDVDPETNSVEEQKAYHGIGCNDCGASWTAIFTLSGYCDLMTNPFRTPITECHTDFYGFTVVVEDRLGGEGVDNVASIVGYAFRELAGEACDLAGSSHKNDTTEIMIFWDSTKSASDDIGLRLPGVIENLETYLLEGTPVRKTNRAGVGTRGTRLVESPGFTLVGVYVTEE